MDTTKRTLQRGDELRKGRLGSYHLVEPGPGEAHIRREELLEAGTTSAPSRPGAMARELRSARARVLAHLVQLSDFQLVDPTSPARMEFAEWYGNDPRFAPLVPAQRPQETLVRPALASLVATISDLGESERTSTAPELAIATGDVIDSAQENELAWYLALMDGGRVDPLWPHLPEGLYSPDWPNAQRFWSPEDHPDEAKTDWGFPTLPGLLNNTAFTADGLDLPWLACHGNHESLVQGVLPVSRDLDRLAKGGTKPFDFPNPLPEGDLMSALLRDPGLFYGGPSQAVRPEAQRQLLAPGHFAAAHLRLGARPAGHGFSEKNAERGENYYVFDELEGIRLIVLDTAHPGGAALGSIGSEQLNWLESRLAEVSTTYLDRGQRSVRNQHGKGRLVVVASHHGPAKLTNDLPCPNDETRHGGAEVVSLLHRFPNVIAWCSGHTHCHEVKPYPHPRSGGFWSITTGAVMDWPSQARQLEIVENSDNTVSIWSTLIDHGAPPDPKDASGLVNLAARHRELAGNHLWRSGSDRTRGTSLDRNVELVVPFPGLM